MKICASCGASLPDQAVSCVQCGSRQFKMPAPPANYDRRNSYNNRPSFDNGYGQPYQNGYAPDEPYDNGYQGQEPYDDQYDNGYEQPQQYDGQYDNGYDDQGQYSGQYDNGYDGQYDNGYDDQGQYNDQYDNGYEQPQQYDGQYDNGYDTQGQYSDQYDNGYEQPQQYNDQYDNGYRPQRQYQDRYPQQQQYDNGYAAQETYNPSYNNSYEQPQQYDEPETYAEPQQQYAEPETYAEPQQQYAEPETYPEPQQQYTEPEPQPEPAAEPQAPAQIEPVPEVTAEQTPPEPEAPKPPAFDSKNFKFEKKTDDEEEETAKEPESFGGIKKVLNLFLKTPDHTNDYDPNEVVKAKGISIAAMFGITFWVPLVLRRNSMFGRFYANQGLLMLILCIPFSILFAIFSGIVGVACSHDAAVAGASSGLTFMGWIMDLIVFAICYAIPIFILILSIKNIRAGKAKEIPFIGFLRIIK